MFSNKNEKGIMSLAVIFVVGFFGLGLALTITMVALVGLNKNYNTNSGNQTFYTAEAAAREGVYQYLSTSTYSGGNAFPELINNASDTVFVDASGPIFTFISGNAENNLTYRTVKYKLERIPGSMTFSYAIFATGDLTLGGGVDINCEDGSIIICDDFSLGASVFSNATMTLSGSSLDIDGGAYSGNTITTNGNPDVEDGTFQNVEEISFPEIDLQPYINTAIASSTFFNTAADAETYLNNSTSGIVFIAQETGQTSIQNDVLEEGSIVSLNNLSLNNGHYTATGTYAAIIAEKDLYLGGGVIIDGIVYVKGVTRFFGNGTINGALISIGGIDASGGGNIKINYNPDISEEFKDISGLDKTPIIVGWQEQ